MEIYWGLERALWLHFRVVFSNKTHGYKPREEYSFINVGNEQFHAAAVALIDSLYSTQRGNDAVLKNTRAFLSLFS